MLERLKRLWSRDRTGHGAWSAAAGWAQGRGHQFRASTSGERFGADGRLGTVSWRLDWGPSQRNYIHGTELSLRADLSMPGDLQAMVLDKPLQVAMERAIFNQYVEGVQTRIDDSTPPEMRWLVMLAKLGPQELGALRDNFAAVGSSKPWVQAWLEGETMAMATLS